MGDSNRVDGVSGSLLAARLAPVPGEPQSRTTAGPRRQRKVLVLGVLAAVQVVALTDLGLAAARYAGVVADHGGSGTSTTATSAPPGPGPTPGVIVATARPSTPGLLPGATITVPPATTASTTASTTTPSTTRSRSKVTSTTVRNRR